jgi:chitodextrinase
MAKPTVTITLLTPISIRLSWAGSGDFEVWWKSDHPAGQEYSKLALVTGTSYDVGSLSWTTTYYFKVRNVGDEFSDEISVFICCGQAVVGGPGIPPGGGGPPVVTKVDFWQQAADPDGGEVAFVAKDTPHENIYLWVYSGGAWSFKGLSTYEGAFFPVAARKVGGNVAIFDMDELSLYANAYIFRYWNGTSMVENAFTDMGGDGFTQTWEGSLNSLPYSMVFNEDGRIVIGISYIDWDDWQNQYPEKIKIRVSHDRGATWGPMIDISSRVSSSRANQISMAETDDGAVWILCGNWTDVDPPYYGNQPNYVKYDLYKYVEGSGVSLIRSIVTTLASAWGPAPFYTKTGWGASCSNANIYAEGSKIVICYVNDFVHTIPVGTPDYCGLAQVYVDVSNDSGATWETHEVVLPGAETILWNPEWASLIPTVCISSGNILVYLLKGTGRATSAEPLILKSTDDGATWSTVYTFLAYDADYPWVFQLRADGDHVTGTGCGAATEVDGNLAFWESLDAGATWTARELIPEIEPQILVPA